jgi:tetrahydromethanopterin S-methyltransferase subunit E
MMAVNYPKVMLPIFILTLIITAIIAVVLSNAYVEITKQADLASASLFQQGIYFIMAQLPYLAVIIGLLAIIIIFTRDGSAGAAGGIIN